MTTYKQRQKLFSKLVSYPVEGYPSPTASPTNTSQPQEEPDYMVDMDELYQLSSKGIPSTSGYRPLIWKLLLNYLPADKRLWQSTLKAKRRLYYQFVTDICSTLNLKLPLSESTKEANRKDYINNEEFKDKTIKLDCKLLEQIDIDVRRTLSDHTFFQTKVTTTPLQSPTCSTFSNKVDLLNMETEIDGSCLIPFDKVSVDNRRAIFNQLSPKPSIKTKKYDDNNQFKSHLGLINKEDNTTFQSNRSSISDLTLLQGLDSSADVSPRTLADALNLPCDPFNDYVMNWVTEPHQNLSLDESEVEENEQVEEVEEMHFEAMERILFIYAKLNPGVSYVQGMNDLLGPIYYVLANDIEDSILDGKNHCEADAFFLFTALMASVRDQFVQQLDKDLTVGVRATLNKLMNKLNQVAPDLHDDLINKGLDPTFYAFRWITVLGSHEFDLPNTIQLWDRLFSKLPLYDFCENGIYTPNLGPSSPSPINTMTMVGVAMLCLLKNRLLQGSFADNLQLLQNFPKSFKIADVVDLAYKLESLPPGTTLDFENFIPDSITTTPSNLNISQLEPIKIITKGYGFNFNFMLPTNKSKPTINTDSRSMDTDSNDFKLVFPTKPNTNNLSFKHRLVKSFDATRTFLKSTHKLNHGY